MNERLETLNQLGRQSLIIVERGPINRELQKPSQTRARKKERKKRKRRVRHGVSSGGETYSCDFSPLFAMFSPDIYTQYASDA